MDKYRVAILTTSDYPYWGAGENFTREMALGLKQNNVNVEVVRFWGDRYSNVNDTTIVCSEYLFRKPARNEIMKIVELICQVLYIPVFILFLKFIKKQQILIINGLETAYFCLPLIVFSKIFRLKCYRIITEIFPENAVAAYWWRKPILIFYRMQLKRLDKYMNGVIVLSKYLSELCLSNGVKNEKIILIPNFIDLEKIKSPGIPENFRICFCGTASVENGVLDLLSAFKIISSKVPEAELIIIGEMDSSISGIIDREGHRSEKVIFTGQLSRKEVFEQYSKCHVLVNPRRRSILAESGFPSKIGEYFSTCKPVVSTKVGDLIYYFTDKKELIFSDPDCSESLAESILFTYRNTEKAKEIGLNGFEWAQENLNSVKNGKKLVDFFTTT